METCHESWVVHETLVDTSKRANRNRNPRSRAWHVDKHNTSTSVRLLLCFDIYGAVKRDGLVLTVFMVEVRLGRLLRLLLSTAECWCCLSSACLKGQSRADCWCHGAVLWQSIAVILGRSTVVETTMVLLRVGAASRWGSVWSASLLPLFLCPTSRKERLKVSSTFCAAPFNVC